ncbi:MAG: PIG-L family deacetylase [candidate division FCPU426 bacterium]
MSSAFKFSAQGAEVYVPDELALPKALTRVTHLGVGAHQDDLEFMAFAPILECFGAEDKWFAGVTCTNGAGSARDSIYASYTDAQMMVVRRGEQRKAALIGEYAAQFQLNHPSSLAKDPNDELLVEDLLRILEATRPEAVYTHNLADKHDTHVAVALKLITAIRQLPKAARPKSLTGCEVWRDLDWMEDADKVVMAVDGHENLGDALMGVFDSQICGGKRYDLATRGRRKAHATYFESHATDKSQNLIFGMDMTPLIEDDKLSPDDLIKSYMKNFQDEVLTRLKGLQ